MSAARRSDFLLVSWFLKLLNPNVIPIDLRSESAETMYYFTALALTLNESDDSVAPTDSRRRPDQRLMEDGRWDEANSEKQRLEEKQRIARREREREAASQRTSSQSEEGETGCLSSAMSRFAPSVFLSVFHGEVRGEKTFL